jgi:hydroxymethylpyrimidine pyrophosphatase-like HAD family hydrolase
MTQAAAGEQLAMPIFCANGALLYRAEQGGQYYLRQQLPRLRAKTLLTLDYPFQPLACP